MGANTKKKNSTQESKKYVACSRARRGLGCKFVKWDYIDLENQILTFCKYVDFDKIIRNSETEIELKINEKEQQLNELKDKARNNEFLLANLTSKIVNEVNTAIPKVLLARMNELELELEKFNSEIDIAASELTQLKIDATTQKESIHESRNLIDMLSKTKGAELFDLRIRLSSNLKKSIKEIYLSPGGQWISNETIKALEKIYEGDNDIHRVTSFTKSYSNFPNKNERSLLIHFLNGSFRSVHSGSKLEKSDPYISEFFKDSDKFS